MTLTVPSMDVLDALIQLRLITVAADGSLELLGDGPVVVPNCDRQAAIEDALECLCSDCRDFLGYDDWGKC